MNVILQTNYFWAIKRDIFIQILPKMVDKVDIVCFNSVLNCWKLFTISESIFSIQLK